MNKLKVCFVGIGSIAKRHIKNLKVICVDRNIDVQIDAYRRRVCKTEYVDNVYTNINDVPSDYDVVFITNPTEYHLDAFKVFHKKGTNFFIEKPVVSCNQIDEAMKVKLNKNSIYYVACPLRYSAVIQWIKRNISASDVISVRSISSSYLPEWRPNQDYRDTYSAHKALGGGVSIDLIHEWDYITYLFGWPNNIKSLIGKKSELDIDSDDYAIYIAEYEDKIVEIHLDYFGRKTIREVQLFTRTDTIIGDIANNTVKLLKSGKKITFDEERDDYQKRELDYFLSILNHEYNSESEFSHGLKVLELTQGRMTM